MKYTQYYYMTSSVSGQDEPLGPARPKIIFWCFIQYRKKTKSFIDQAYSVKMAGYWPRSFFACLWTKTNINTQKNNLANT